MMSVYAGYLPLITAILGYGILAYSFLTKKLVWRKRGLASIAIFCFATYGLCTTLAMHTPENTQFWAGGMLFLSIAFFAMVFLTIQFTRDIRESDALFLMIFFISTVAVVLAPSSATEEHGVHLAKFSPGLLSIFMVYVGIACAEIFYNTYVTVKSAIKHELHMYLTNMLYFGVAASVAVLSMCVDAVFVYAITPAIPLTPVFSSITVFALGMFAFKS